MRKDGVCPLSDIDVTFCVHRVGGDLASQPGPIQPCLAEVISG